MARGEMWRALGEKLLGTSLTVQYLVGKSVIFKLPRTLCVLIRFCYTNFFYFK